MAIVSAASVVIIPALISISLSLALDFSTCYDGICYHKSNEKMSWVDALFYCEHDGEAALVSVHSAAQNTFIYYILCDWDDCWLGLFQNALDWTWMDGSAVSYLNWDWQNSEPNADEYVAVMLWNDKWHSVDPTYTYHALCMKNETPHNLAHSIAPDISTCYEGICYHRGIRRMTWYDAVFYCHLRNAALVTVQSAAQQQYIEDHVCTDIGLYSCWLGLIFSYRLDSWIWMDGSALNYSNYSPQQPEAGEYLTAMAYFGEWIGFELDRTCYPICMTKLMTETTNTINPTKSPTTDPTRQPTPGHVSQQHVIAITITEQEFSILLTLLICMCLLCACLGYIARRSNRVVSVVPELQMHAIKDETNSGVEKSSAEGKVNAIPGTSGSNI